MARKEVHNQFSYAAEGLVFKCLSLHSQWLKPGAGLCGHLSWPRSYTLSNCTAKHFPLFWDSSLFRFVFLLVCYSLPVMYVCWRLQILVAFKNDHYDSLFKMPILLLFRCGEANRSGDCHWKSCLFTAPKRGGAGPALPLGREGAQGSTRVRRSQREKEKNMGKSPHCGFWRKKWERQGKQSGCLSLNCCNTTP